MQDNECENNTRITKEKILWNNAAKDYDKSSVKFEEAYKKLTVKCSEIFTDSENILDIACGTGMMSFKLADKVNHVTGIDLSEEMIKIAEEKLQQTKSDNITFKNADGYNTGFQDESFDAVLLLNVLHVVKEPDRLIDEARRIVKKGGYLVTLTDCYDEKLPFFKKIYHLVPKLMKKFGIITYLNCYKKADIIKLLTKHAFEIKDTAILFDAPLNYYVSARK